MTTREAARPLRRYLRARVRAASLPPTYTITRDVTRVCRKSPYRGRTAGANLVSWGTNFCAAPKHRAKKPQ